ncbi:MAG TPA: M23 family metallopeptidase [Usitatibacter sp.]|nr:M23 family metallopeptidase [Usitatibacter sp.]
MAGEFFAAPGRRPTTDRVVLLVLLLSTLAVVSCATILEREAAQSSIARVEPAPAAPSPPPETPVPEAPRDPLAARALAIPVRGVEPGDLRDNFSSRRGKRAHNALDIMAPRGTPVIAADDGRVARMYHHPLGGLSVYQYDPGERFAYYYAHMDRFADDLREGRELRRGEVLGYVGTTGNASPTAPHLHFAVYRLGPDRKWWRGQPVNPYPYLSSPAPASP